MRAALAFPALLLLLPAACGHRPPAAPTAAATTQPLQFEHDFGVIPHGERRTHEFVVDLKLLGDPYVPMRVHLDCSCGRADLRLRKRDGSEREVIPSGMPSNVPTADEQLVMVVTLDTANKEAADLPHTSSRGYLLLQHQNDESGTSRIQWPVLLHFGIDAPVDVRPFTSLDFGKVPLSRTPEVLTTVRGDAKHANARAVAIRCVDPQVTATLEPAADHVVVRVRCAPNAAGNHRTSLTITTDLPDGYHFEVPVTWKAVPDLEATPMPKVAFRAALDRSQRDDEAVGQFVLVADHDLRRKPEFAVQKIVTDDGRDVAASFAVTFVPLPNDARQQRLQVRYLGGLTAGMRGSLVLTKDGDSGPFLPIELVVFPAKDP